MKIQPKNLKLHLKNSNLRISEVVDKMNKLLPKNKRPITRQAIYHYFRGASPDNPKGYLLAVVLGVTPDELFELKFDSKIYEKFYFKAKEIFNE